jgi:hypothetical protein
MKNDTINEAAKNTKPSGKEAAIQMLEALQDKMFERATAAIRAEPKKTIMISRAIDKDLARIEFTINQLRIRM